MTLLLATTFGLIVWVVLWATGTKAFDSFLLTLTIIIIAAGFQIASRLRTPEDDER